MKSLITFALILSANAAMAAMSVTYDCMGKDNSLRPRTGIEFDIDFATWSGNDYTEKFVTVKTNDPKNPKTIDLTEVKVEGCSKKAKMKFELEPVSQGSAVLYARIQRTCGGKRDINIFGYCRLKE